MSDAVRISAKASETKRENKTSHPPKPEFSQSINSPVEQILFLQRTIGNQAVGRLIKSGALQAKLRIGAPGDIYEQEADRVAEQVMRMQEKKAVSVETANNTIQRTCPKCSGCRLPENEEVLQPKEVPGLTPEITPGLEADINSIRGGGEPLPESVRAFFEPRFGKDFSQVRVHADAKVAEAARAVYAKAFTVGTDMVFGEGEYAPETASGQKLLAHELTHVVQQAVAPTIDTLKLNGCDATAHINPISRYPTNPTVTKSMITTTASDIHIQRKGISFELEEAPLLSVPTTQTGISEDEMRVLAWLRLHAEEIIAAEARFNVDRRAIAGAIACEAIENVRSFGIKAVGPGKVHVKTGILIGSEETVAKQVEEAGYLQKQTLAGRTRVLKTPSGAITYIGAIMAAFADEAARSHSGGWSGEDIRCRPEILTNAYQGEDLRTWKARLDKKKLGEPLKPGNPMAIWVQHHLAYLEDAVGKQGSSICTQTILFKEAERKTSTAQTGVGLKEIVSEKKVIREDLWYKIVTDALTGAKFKPETSNKILMLNENFKFLEMGRFLSEEIPPPFVTKKKEKEWKEKKVEKHLIDPNIYRAYMEAGENRGKLIALIGSSRNIINGFTAEELNIKDKEWDEIKGYLNRKLNALTPYYTQMANINILFEKQHEAWTRTCNVTSLSMVLEALGVAAEEFSGDKTLIERIGNFIEPSRFKTYTDLLTLRLPDFLQLVAIYTFMPSASFPDYQFQVELARAKNSASKAIWSTLSIFEKIATLFGVRYIKSDSVQSYGSEKFEIEKKVGNLEKKKKEILEQEFWGLIGEKYFTEKYEELEAYEHHLSKFTESRYKNEVVKKIGRWLDAGGQVIVNLPGHYVRLENFDEMGIIFDDPYTPGKNFKITWADANQKGYFRSFVLVKKC